MRIALVHYWLVTMRGGEKVLEELCRLYPEADIFTHVVDPNKISDTIKAHRITTSFINKLPGAVRHYQKYVPLMPMALEQLDLRNYDLVISSESGPAKGVITGANTLHICYCHTPMRYLWNMYHDYYENAGFITRLAMAPAFHYMRLWDYAAAARVDHFVANSQAVAARISKVYRRPSQVIHPPVDIASMAPASSIGDYYLYCGQLVPYKRADIAIQAFNQLGKKLVVVGEGSDLGKLKREAGPTIHFSGRQTDQQLRNLYAHCRALVFPGEEDFGIVPVEAMAHGRPVIAYDKGGIKDTVTDGVSGILYPEQNADGLMSAIMRFEKEELNFSPSRIVKEAERFSTERFRIEMRKFIEDKMNVFGATGSTNQ